MADPVAIPVSKVRRPRPVVHRHLLLIAIFSGLCSSVAAAEHSPAVRPSNAKVVVPEGGESVPMLDFGGRPMVEVLINGKGPYPFILDTGAAATVVDSALADELSLEGSGRIQELGVGKAQLRDLRVVTAPISGMFGTKDAPRGVLSASAFGGSLVSFDYPSRRIAFRNAALPAADGRTIFDYEGADLPSVPLRVAGRQVTVHLDTGAPYAVALPTRYMKELPLATPAVLIGSARSHGGSFPIFAAPLEGEISIGELRLPTRDLHFTDIVPFGAVEPKGQLGAEALRDFVMTLDSLQHRVRFERPAAAAAR